MTRRASLSDLSRCGAAHVLLPVVAGKGQDHCSHPQSQLTCTCTTRAISTLLPSWGEGPAFPSATVSYAQPSDINMPQAVSHTTSPWPLVVTWHGHQPPDHCYYRATDLDMVLNYRIDQGLSIASRGCSHQAVRHHSSSVLCYRQEHLRCLLFHPVIL